jgi:hypothetical protein
VEGFQETCTPGAVAENVLYRAIMVQFLFLAVERCPDEPESVALAKLLSGELDERLFSVMAKFQCGGYQRKGYIRSRLRSQEKLAVRMYWMLRSQAKHAQMVRMQGSPRGTLVEQ